MWTTPYYGGWNESGGASAPPFSFGVIIMGAMNQRVGTGQPHCGCGESIPAEGMGTVWRCTFPGCGQWIDTRDPTADHLFPMATRNPHTGQAINQRECTCSVRWTLSGYCHDCDLPLPTLETGVAGKGGDE